VYPAEKLLKLLKKLLESLMVKSDTVKLLDKTVLLKYLKI